MQDAVDLYFVLRINIHYYVGYDGMEPKWRLRRIGILSAVKIGGVVACAMGFIIGTVWATILAFFSSLIAVAMDSPMPGMGPVMVLLLPFFAAIFYLVFGSLVSFLVALLYNIAAGFLGGVEFDLGFERKEETDSFI